MAIQTVQSCIKDLNKDDFYKNQVKNTLLGKFKLLMCCLSVMKYESHFYEAQGDYTRKCCNAVTNPLKDKIKHRLLKAPDGLKIDCWDINPCYSDKYIIICGGIGSEKSNLNLQEAYLKFVEKGWGVIAFDYRGRGKSAGLFCQKSAYEDTFAVWNHLILRGINPSNIAILGHSMGAGVALDFASKHSMSQVILINPFNKAVDMVRNIARQLVLPKFIKKTVQKLPDFLIPIKNRFNNELALKKVYAPTLILHNNEDDTIPVELCRKLIEKNQDKNNVTYFELDGTDHEINNDKIDMCINFMQDSHLWFFNQNTI